MLTKEQAEKNIRELENKVKSLTEELERQKKDLKKIDLSLTNRGWYLATSRIWGDRIIFSDGKVAIVFSTEGLPTPTVQMSGTVGEKRGMIEDGKGGSMLYILEEEVYNVDHIRNAFRDLRNARLAK